MSLQEIPGEIRNEIYVHLFRSTRLTFGDKHRHGRFDARWKPAGNSLAILYTCRQFNQEAKGIWLSHVLFNFEHADDVIDKLSSLPPTIVAQIRHIRTHSRNMLLRPTTTPATYFYQRSSLSEGLEFFSELNLDTLTMIGTAHGPGDFMTLDDLIKTGTRWKELRFITLGCVMVQFAAIDSYQQELDWSRPQPQTWEETLRQRDGMESGSSIKVYRSIEPGPPGTILNPNRRENIKEIVRPYGRWEIPFIDANEDTKKEEVVFIVKRGHAATIAETSQPLSSEENGVCSWSGNMTWSKIRRRCLEPMFSMADAEQSAQISQVVEDTYEDVDRYEWQLFLS